VYFISMLATGANVESILCMFTVALVRIADITLHQYCTVFAALDQVNDTCSLP
jgi:hypothetical protein